MALEDEGYESCSENFNIPTPLRRTLKIHYVSSVENASFDPDPVTQHSIKESHLRPVCRQLTYSSSDDVDTPEDEAPSPHNNSQVQPHRPDPQTSASKQTLDAHVYLEEDEEEDFQTVPLDDTHWTTEEVPTDHYAHMNIPYHMAYVHIHIHMQTISLLPTSRPWN